MGDFCTSFTAIFHRSNRGSTVLPASEGDKSSFNSTRKRSRNACELSIPNNSMQDNPPDISRYHSRLFPCSKNQGIAKLITRNNAAKTDLELNWIIPAVSTNEQNR